MLDDCKGEMLEKLLSEFSTAVLRKALNTEEAGKKSVVERLCTDVQMRAEAHTSLLPLTVAHRASLTRKLEAKRSLRARYEGFGNALQCKDSELVNKFEKVVETQSFLDQNPPSESTVERVSKVLDQYWQGDRRQIDVIAQGEEHHLADTLLDQRFETVWRKTSDGSFDGDISTSRHGMLEDLEKRVAMQKARLERWKNYKSTMEQGNPTRREKLATTSPVRHVFGSPHDHRYIQRKGKDLVFSPRKSPRKSTPPVHIVNGIINSEDHELDFISGKPHDVSPSPTANNLDDVDSSPLTAKSTRIGESLDRDLSSNDSIDGTGNEAGVSIRPIPAHISENVEAAVSKGHSTETSKDGLSTIGIQRDPHRENPKIDMSGIRWDSQHVQPWIRDDDGMATSKIVDNDVTTVHRIKPQALSPISTGPQPPEPKPSLVERTQQSMAYTTPNGGMLRDESHLPAPQSTPQQKPSLQEPNIKVTLAERTRQSILQVPTKSKYSTQARRTSKVYPTNQFETPKRQQTLQEMTPPEELMSPGAGYDSVFKSRPKVAFSPTASPTPDNDVHKQVEMIAD